MGSRNNGYRGEKKEVVTLSCGCTRRVWDKPRPGVKFSCPNGLGHGYRLDWVKAESTEPGWHTTNQERKKG